MGARKLCTGVPIGIAHEGDATTAWTACGDAEMSQTVVMAELLAGPSRRVLKAAASTNTGADVECFSESPTTGVADLDASCLAALVQAGELAFMAKG